MVISNGTFWIPNGVKNENKIEYLTLLEASAAKDKKIVNTEASFTEDKSNFILANSEGFSKGFKT